MVYFFMNANSEYARIGNAYKNQTKYAKSTQGQAGPQTPEEEARKFASIVSQAKEAVKAIDARYLDQQQKEQVMETFVKLVSIRSPSGAEGLIRDELKQIMGTLGAKEIDCRKGDTNAPLNLVMEFAASEDLKDDPAILLNAHIDTVGGGQCTPGKMEFDTVKSNFYHRDNGSYGADDKSGVTMVVEALRTLKRDYWDKGYSHRRIVVVFTAQEESGRQGAEYLATHYRELFDNLDFSFTVDGWLWGDWGSYEYPQTPHLAGLFKSKIDTFKARQLVTIMEKFAKERNKPIYIGRRATALSAPIDAMKFPPEGYRIIFFHTPNHATAWHSENRNNVGQLIDYVDMLINVLERLDEDYAKAVSTARDEEIKSRLIGAEATSTQLHSVTIDYPAEH
jgi:putative aminopeptidase FrvX